MVWRKREKKDRLKRMENPALKKLLEGIRKWMINLENYPGWMEWNTKKTIKIFRYDDVDDFYKPFPKEFNFSSDITMQHELIMLFLALQNDIVTLKSYKYYFRRYPFKGLPINRYEHIANMCEMYFSRVYQIRELIKKYCTKLTDSVGLDKLTTKELLKYFDETFKDELRERNQIHHHRRFECLSIDSLMLHELDLLKQPHYNKTRVNNLYKKICKEWVDRIRRKSDYMDRFLEAIANVTLSHCEFLA